MHMVSGLDRSILKLSLGRILDMQADRIESDIEWIDSRIESLGSSDEDSLERRLLEIIRDSLVKDLEEIQSFKGGGLEVDRLNL